MCVLCVCISVCVCRASPCISVWVSPCVSVLILTLETIANNRHYHDVAVSVRRVFGWLLSRCPRLKAKPVPSPEMAAEAPTTTAPIEIPKASEPPPLHTPPGSNNIVPKAPGCVVFGPATWGGIWFPQGVFNLLANAAPGIQEIRFKAFELKVSRAGAEGALLENGSRLTLAAFDALCEHFRPLVSFPLRPAAAVRLRVNAFRDPEQEDVDENRVQMPFTFAYYDINVQDPKDKVRHPYTPFQAGLARAPRGV